MIRPMAPADRGTVLDLIEETGFFRPDEVKVAEELIDIYLGHPGQRDYDLVVVEDAAGNVAGYMTWGPTPLALGTYDLYWMAVSPKAQGRGHGKALVRWLEGRVAELGGRLIVELAERRRAVGRRPLGRVGEDVDPEADRILRAMSSLTLYRMLEKARADLKRGDIHAASRRLQNLASHLLAQGQHELARSVLNEISHIQQHQSFSAEGEKQIKYGTRSLLMPPGTDDK